MKPKSQRRGWVAPVLGARAEPYRLWWQFLCHGLVSDVVDDKTKQKALKRYADWGDVLSYWQPPKEMKEKYFTGDLVYWGKDERKRPKNRFDQWFAEIGQWLFEAAEIRLPSEDDPKSISALQENYHVVLIPKSYDKKSLASTVSEIVPGPEHDTKWIYGSKGRWKEMRYHLRVFDKHVLEGKTASQTFIEIVEEDEERLLKNPKSFAKSRATQRERFAWSTTDKDEERTVRAGETAPQRIKMAIYTSKQEAIRQIESVMKDGVFPAPARPPRQKKRKVM